MVTRETIVSAAAEHISWEWHPEQCGHGGCRVTRVSVERSTLQCVPGMVSLAALAPPLSSPEGDSAVSAIVLISVSHNSTNVVPRNWEKYYLKHETF